MYIIIEKSEQLRVAQPIYRVMVFNMKNRYTLATIVKAARAELGLTQAELAVKAKLHRATVLAIEAGGADPSAKTLARLAVALNVPIVDLVSAAE